MCVPADGGKEETDRTMDEVTESGGLQEKQRSVAYAMVRGGQTMNEVLEQFGVSETEFSGWLLDGGFTEYVMSLARGFAETDLPYVWKILREMVQSESVPAIRLYFDLAGKKPPAQGAGRTSADAAELAGLRERIFGGTGDDVS